MPREIVLGNGELLVNLDHNLFVRDIYYPYVGWANHVGGHRCRVGAWTEGGALAWLDEGGWDRKVAYAEGTLVTDCVLRHTGLGVRLSVAQAVAHDRNIFLQRFTVENTADEARQVRLFFAHDLRIDESDIGDTAFYHPWHRAMIHYKRDRYFLFGGEVGKGAAETGEGIWQYACGEKGFRGAEGTWRDAEDGLLSMNAIAQGSVDSVVSYRLTIPGRGRGTLRVWMTAHENAEEAAALQTALQTQGFDEALAATAAHGRALAADCRPDLDRLPPRVAALFTRSLLLIRTQADKRGAILASNDSDIMETARAHYSYMWPRDGALVSYALDRVGLREMSRPFFEFCARVLPKDRAALMHKYGPDGTVGASWHPWIVDGQPEIPFQEDGTALVVWGLWHHYQQYGDKDFLAAMYRRLARPAAEFMAGFRDTKTRLPLPSWDIWEERRGAHIWTTAAVAAALAAAADIARLLGDAKPADTFHRASQEVSEALLAHFWDEDAGRFARMVTTDAGGGPARDLTVDSSASALFLFGVLPPDDPKMVATMHALGRHLWVRAGAGGLARYERDYYFRVSDDFEKVPGNPWIICTLWLADWYIATAKSEAEMRGALDLLEWATLCALSTGVLSEQVHPHTLQPLSVAPLTWSHAQFVQTATNYLDKLAALAKTT
ncbi:MAG: glycoside hydrolase family 15 protein [Armatimonadetes bacterium]|nr:glycoside hydrolase family 15 protein [Armatimonadota bacterium]